MDLAEDILKLVNDVWDVNADGLFVNSLNK